LGAVVGSSIAASSNYYDRGYYDGGYAPAYGPAYYAPAPVYVEPTFVYRSGYSYPRYDRYEHAYAHRDWRDGRYDHRR
jgi:hypothetical protein